MIKYILKLFAYVACIGLIMWILASWIDVLMHNDPLTGDRRYNPANAFVIMTEVTK